MRIILSIACSFILTSTVSGQDSKSYSDSCKSSCYEKNINICNLKELGKDYQRLRKLQSIECDKFNSNLHIIMSCLGDSIGKSGIGTNEIEKYMGAADSKDKNQIEGMLKLNIDEEILVYFWRGWHDFLYFVIYEGKVKCSGWWFAYE
jgi:hypothetical protein